jgi:hypothetical protein
MSVAKAGEQAGRNNYLTNSMILASNNNYLIDSDIA